MDFKRSVSFFIFNFVCVYKMIPYISSFNELSDFFKAKILPFFPFYMPFYVNLSKTNVSLKS